MTALAASTLLGGIGLFLLGMSLMTDSLAALGGNTLRRLVRSLTKNRYYGLLIGAGITATLQSSSATTLVTVGFVSAGLLTFSQSLGVIFGANIGTTSTAWIVSQLGLEVHVSAVALPLVGAGALLRLITRGRRARLGLAISGFGLIFVGIDVMQAGMGQLDLDLTPGGDSTGVLALLGLVLAGIVMTVIMQSSSAAVATTLVALHAGSINLDQAAALVIGQNVGTTITAILGAIGGNLAARRAAAAHTLFNVATGALALVLLGPFLALVRTIGETFVDTSPETLVALFHTTFNVFGVALFVPFTPRFARVIERLLPEHKDPATERLSRGALQIPAMALEAARASTAEIAMDAMHLGATALRSTNPTQTRPVWRRALTLITAPRTLLEGTEEASRALADRLRKVKLSTESLSDYLARIRTAGAAQALRSEHVELLHALDHLRRLVSAIEREEPLSVIAATPELQHLAASVVEELDPLLEPSDGPPLMRSSAIAEATERIADAEEARRDTHRALVLERIADGVITPVDAEVQLSASRWIGKIPRHIYRVFRHLAWTAGTPAIAADDDDDNDDNDDG